MEHLSIRYTRCMNRYHEPACDSETKKGKPALDQNAGPTKLTREEVARLVEQQAASWRRIDAMPDTAERRAKREAFQRDALRAWAEYRKTGLHVTAEEMDRWMATWVTNHELPPPVCHT